jgi:hypothetical protein
MDRLDVFLPTHFHAVAFTLCFRHLARTRINGNATMAEAYCVTTLGGLDRAHRRTHACARRF